MDQGFSHLAPKKNIWIVLEQKMELIWENPFYPHLHKIQSQNKHLIFLQADEEYLNEDIVSILYL